MLENHSDEWMFSLSSSCPPSSPACPLSSPTYPPSSPSSLSDPSSPQGLKEEGFRCSDLPKVFLICGKSKRWFPSSLWNPKPSKLVAFILKSTKEHVGFCFESTDSPYHHVDFKLEISSNFQVFIQPYQPIALKTPFWHLAPVTMHEESEALSSTLRWIDKSEWPPFVSDLNFEVEASKYLNVSNFSIPFWLTLHQVPRQLSSSSSSSSSSASPSPSPSLSPLDSSPSDSSSSPSSFFSSSSSSASSSSSSSFDSSCSVSGNGNTFSLYDTFLVKPLEKFFQWTAISSLWNSSSLFQMICRILASLLELILCFAMIWFLFARILRRAFQNSSCSNCQTKPWELLSGESF